MNFNSTPENQNPNAAAPAASHVAAVGAAAVGMSSAGLLDFDSDEPLITCPLRNNGDTICESCQ